MLGFIKYAFVGYVAVRVGEYVSKKYDQIRKPKAEDESK